MIQTRRLTLRRWRESDRAVFAAINVEPETAYWLGGQITRAQSDRAIDRYSAHIEAHGFGRWAVERLEDGALIGAIGVMPVIGDYAFEGFELGWRLARQTWGQGFATEAARAALVDAFARGGLTEIIAFTSDQNLRSIGVMQRIGMVRDAARDFDHPALAPDHPLLRHMVYAATRASITTA